ncbi:MAG: protein kinase, partial [Burkholderiales bacterium]
MSDNDDKTRVVTGQMPVELPATQATAADLEQPAQHTLPMGTRLGEFEITGLVGEGGFGIVYVAYDHLLQRRVALKEYMPSAYARRTTRATVTPKSEREAETFTAGLRSFVKEAMMLAQFDHPSLVKVFRFWEANGTAYMVMPLYEGRTLKQVLRDMGDPPDEAWLRALLAPLLDALEVMHGHHDLCLHRDIAPDNILLLEDGRPVLLDFGAARRVIADRTQALTAMLKPGFAPIEQYADIPGARQGPWTDIYALAAVVYYAIAGHAPVQSVARMMSDSLEPLSETARGSYSEPFLRAIDHALAVNPDDRTQSIAQLRSELDLEPLSRTALLGGADLLRAGPGDSGQRQEPSFQPRPAASRQSDPGRRATGGGGGRDAGTGASAGGGNPPPRRRVSPIVFGLGGLVAAAVVGLGAWLVVQQQVDEQKRIDEQTRIEQQRRADEQQRLDEQRRAAEEQQRLDQQRRAADEQQRLDQQRRAADEQQRLGEQRRAADEQQRLDEQRRAADEQRRLDEQRRAADEQRRLDEQRRAADEQRRLDDQRRVDQRRQPIARSVDILEAIHVARDPSLRIDVDVGSRQVRIGSDRLRFRIRSDIGGLLYIFMAGTDGAHVYQLFPNALDGNNRIEANRVIELPRQSWEMVAGGPAGRNEFVVMVTPVPRDFSASGVRPGNPFAEFSIDAARRAAASDPDVLAGVPDCPASQP